jgi:hypothetical protein
MMPSLIATTFDYFRLIKSFIRSATSHSSATKTVVMHSKHSSVRISVLISSFLLMNRLAIETQLSERWLGHRLAHEPVVVTFSYVVLGMSVLHGCYYS